MFQNTGKVWISGSQTVCRGTLVCRERSSGVPQNVLEFLNITINSYYN